MDILVADLMLAQGTTPKEWTPAFNEIQNTNIKIDRDGIIISSSESDTKTIIDPSCFQVINESGNKLVHISSKETLLNQAAIQGSLTIGDLQMIPKKAVGVDFMLLGE